MTRTLTFTPPPTSTTEHERVRADDASAGDITELMLQTRRIYLKGRSDRTQYLVDLRKKVGSKQAKPVHMLLALLSADVADGAPVSIVLQPLYAAIGVLRAKAAERETKKGLAWATRMDGAMLREIRGSAKLDEAKHRSAGNLNDMGAAMSLRIALREYKAACEEMEALLDERCAVDRLVA